MLEVTPPSGPFAVGQVDCFWRTPQSEEEADSPEALKVMVRIYYPVEREAAKTCPPGSWLPDSFSGPSYAEAYAKALFKPGVNSALVGTLGFVPLMSNVSTNTVVNAPLVGVDTLDRLPPLIYSHGMLGNRFVCLCLCLCLLLPVSFSESLTFASPSPSPGPAIPFLA